MLGRNCWHFLAINYQLRFSSSTCCCCCWFSFFFLKNINKLCRLRGQRQCALCLLSLFYSQVNFKRYMKRSNPAAPNKFFTIFNFLFSSLLILFLSFSLISYAFRSTRKLTTIVFCVHRPLTYNFSSSSHSFTFIRFHSSLCLLHFLGI